MFAYIIQGTNIIIALDGSSHTVTTSHISYDKIKEAIKANDVAAIRDLINPKQVVINYASGNVEIKGSEFLWKGKPMHNALSTKMIEMLKEGFPIDPLVAFMHNLDKNPSKRAVDELYGFLEKSALPITPDGYFLAYKKVREDYMDCHSGTISNHVGATPSMERNEVDDNKDRTCSSGLHFCSQEYLKNFGGARTMILKINPADVVSIPSDYNDSKGRTCRYEVIGELDAPAERAFTRPVQTNAEGVKRPEPKKGSSTFYMGYSDGYNDRVYTSDDNDYAEGFEKGQIDADELGYARYVYVEPRVVFNTPAPSAWPFPKGA
jgi:hypothetical protein